MQQRQDGQRSPSGSLFVHQIPAGFFFLQFPSGRVPETILSLLPVELVNEDVDGLDDMLVREVPCLEHILADRVATRQQHAERRRAPRPPRPPRSEARTHPVESTTPVTNGDSGTLEVGL